MSMPWLIPSITATITGISCLIFIYCYLYLHDPRKYLFLWAAGLSFYIIRFVFMILTIKFQNNSFLLICNQLSPLASSVFFLWGTYDFLGRQLSVIWVQALLSGAAWIILSVLFKLSFFAASLPAFIFLSFVYFFTGVLFLRSKMNKRTEDSIVGAAFILLAVHAVTYPFLKQSLWFLRWGYIVEEILCFIVSLCLLMVYFRETRTELLRSKKNLSITLDSIGDAVITTDILGKIIRMNPVAEHLTGWKQKQAAGKELTDIFNIINSKTEQKADNPVKKVMETGNIAGLANHTMLISKNGQRYHIADSAAPISDDNGSVFGIVLIFRDVTCDYKMREALQQSEEKFRLAFHASPDAINLNTAGSGAYIDVNKGFSEIMGYSGEEVIGKTALELNIWKNIKDRESFISELKSHGFVDNFEAEFVGKNGKIITGLLSARPLTIDNKDAVLFVTRDITEKKLSESAVQESEEKYRSMMEAINDAVYICSSEYIIEYMNPAMIRRTGRDATGEICYSSIHGFNEKCSWCVHEKIIKGENINHEIGIPKTNKTYHISSSPVFHADGSVSSLTVLRDISELKKIQAQLHQSQKMESIGVLAGGIAHDFNNILFPILGYSEMLLKDIPEDSSMRKGLNSIHSGAVRARDLIKQIFTFARQDTSKLRPMRLQPMVKEALKLIRAIIPATIDIEQDISSDCGEVNADPTNIHQIIMNLITNAYHAMMDTGGNVKVSLKEITLDENDLIEPDVSPGLYACLIVADTGIGMNKELIGQIFDPFFTTKEKGRGTGLGLSVVHGIVKSMNGMIRIYSEPGMGTEFCIYLPVRENTHKHQILPEVNRSMQGNMEKILLVDDNETILIMEEKMLKILGYQVISNTSSPEALEVFRDSPDKFDLIITDMAMPDMSGDKLAVEIIKIRPDIPVLLCTGFSEIMSEKKAASLGIKGFLMKPVTMKELAQKIREILN